MSTKLTIGGEGVLTDKGKDHVVLFVQRALASLLAETAGGLAIFALHALDRGFRDLGKLGEDEENGDSDTSACNTQIDELHIDQVARVTSSEEGLGSDQRADERSDAVPRLAELEARRSCCRIPDDDGVRVGCRFQRRETTGNNGSAGAETTKASGSIAGRGEVSGRPEEHGADRVECQAHEDGDLVALSLQDFCCDGREGQVTETKVHNLESSTLQLGDAEHRLEVLVKHIEQSVGEAPEEEERGDEEDGIDQLAACEVAALELVGRDGKTAACHFRGYGCCCVWISEGFVGEVKLSSREWPRRESDSPERIYRKEGSCVYCNVLRRKALALWMK